VLAAVIVISGGSAPVAAQEVSSGPPAADAHIEALLDRVQALEAVVEAEDRERRVSRGVEMGLKTTSFELGPLSVVTRADQEDEVRGALAEALTFYERTVQGAEDVLSDGNWIVQFYDRDLAADLGAWARGSELIEIRRADGPKRMVTRTRELLGARLGNKLPPPAHDWVAGGVPLMRPGPDVGYTWELLHREAVSSGSIAVHDCLSGEASACWSVLGFPETDNPVEEWYSPEERRRFALLGGQLMMRGDRAFRRGDGSVNREQRKLTRALIRQCRRRIMAACDEMIGGKLDGTPLELVFRTSVLWHALEVGEAGAYGRFLKAVEAGASIRVSLGRAAQQSPDDLVQTWATRVMAARPPVQEDLGLAGFSSLMWMLTFATLGVWGANRRTI